MVVSRRCHWTGSFSREKLLYLKNSYLKYLGNYFLNLDETYIVLQAHFSAMLRNEKELEFQIENIHLRKSERH